jgi:hypothetical protein
MPHAKAPVADGPTLAAGDQNVLTDPSAGFNNVVSYLIHPLILRLESLG